MVPQNGKSCQGARELLQAALWQLAVQYPVQVSKKACPRIVTQRGK